MAQWTKGKPASDAGEKKKEKNGIVCRTMDERKAGIQCRGIDIRKGRDVDVRNGREMVAGSKAKKKGKNHEGRFNHSN